MDFGLTVDITSEINNKVVIIQSLSDNLKEYFKNISYGNDIKSLTIEIVCISPQFDQFYKMKKPKYTKGKKIVNPDGIPFTLEDDLEYSIKLDFDTFKNVDIKEVKNIIANEILASLSVIDQMKSKLKNFDLNSFKIDLDDYFKKVNIA